METRNYLANSRNAVSRFNANGRPANFNALGRPVNVSQARPIMNAAGTGVAFGSGSNYAAMGQAAAPNVAPLFGIQITNNSNAAVSNFDLFGAFQNMVSPSIGGNVATWTNGNLVYGGVTISTLFSTLTYQQFLNSSQAQQFRVGGMYMQVVSASSGTPNTQLAFDVFTVQTGSQSGATQSLPIKPYLNPNQYQTGVSNTNVSFTVDGFTKLVWSTLYATTALQISFFPDTTINPSAALTGGGVVNGYGIAPVQ